MIRNRKFFWIILVLAVLFASFEIAYAATSGYSKAFGGKIENIKANKIEELEASGWICNYGGETVQIKPVIKTMPSSYAIQMGIKKKGSTIVPNKWIIGLYTPKSTSIECTFEDPPATEIVILDTIVLYGTSKY